MVQVGAGDDQYELSEYERLRQERIRKNEAYLASLGLLSKLPKAAAKIRTTNTKKRPNDVVTVQRRSKRLQTKDEKSTEELVMLDYSYSERDDRILRTVQQSKPDTVVDEIINSVDTIDRPVTQRSRPRTTRLDESLVLTDAERKVLSQNMDQNYLDKFREFLVHHDKISAQNERNVMRQVTKLAHGEGIRYESAKYGWPEGCYFLKGVQVTPLSDLVELLQQAIEAENKWGQDRGNGWLLRHPLKKLLLFQQFCLQHPDFLMTNCKLQEYYEHQQGQQQSTEE